jgi:glutamate dehydrogenase (NAD(P)+)
VVIQGFGAVGIHAARFLADRGAVLVAASDSRGGTYNPEGLGLDALIPFKESGRSLRDYPGGQKLATDDIIDVECDIWIPAARPDVVHEENVQRLKTKLVVQGANIPLTLGAERILHDKGVIVVPDFIANAGGVICAAMEFQGGSQTAAFAAIEEKIRANTATVLDAATQQALLPREAVY